MQKLTRPIKGQCYLFQDYFKEVGEGNKDGLDPQVATSVGDTTFPMVSYEIIQKVLDFLCRLVISGATPTMLTFWVPGTYPTSTLAPKVDEALGTHVVSPSCVRPYHDQYQT